METAVTDPLQPLLKFKETADAMAAAAEQYLDLMHTDPPKPATPGQFYITYSGSVVYVARRAEQCNCPACTGRPPGIMMIGPFPFPMPTTPEPATDPHPAPPEAFYAIVIKGGHGMTEWKGWGPGEQFVVLANGIAKSPEIKPENPSLAMACLGMLGLSLRRVTVPTWNQ